MSTGMMRSFVVVTTAELPPTGRFSRKTFPRSRDARCDGWIVVCPVVANRGSRLLELGLRRLQTLVRDIDFLFERVELRVLIDLPPFSFQCLIGRLGGLPVLRRFLVIGRDGRGGPRIARTDGAPGQKQQASEECPTPKLGWLKPNECAPSRSLLRSLRKPPAVRCGLPHRTRLNRVD